MTEAAEGVYSVQLIAATVFSWLLLLTISCRHFYAAVHHIASSIMLFH